MRRDGWLTMVVVVSFMTTQTLCVVECPAQGERFHQSDSVRAVQAQCRQPGTSYEPHFCDVQCSTSRRSLATLALTCYRSRVRARRRPQRPGSAPAPYPRVQAPVTTAVVIKHLHRLVSSSSKGEPQLKTMSSAARVSRNRHVRNQLQQQQQLQTTTTTSILPAGTAV